MNMKPIPEFPGYFASEEGDIYCTRSVNGKGPYISAPRKVKPLLRGKNAHYYQISIARQKRDVHVLVAAAYHGPCPEGMEVSHDDGKSLNNRPGNLSYLTHEENEKMKSLHGTSSAGENNGMAKLTDQQVEEIRVSLLNNYRGLQCRLARRYGVTDATISMIKSGQRRQ
jgi:hypothetical protein